MLIFILFILNVNEIWQKFYNGKYYFFKCINIVNYNSIIDISYHYIKNKNMRTIGLNYICLYTIFWINLNE